MAKKSRKPVPGGAPQALLSDTSPVEKVWASIKRNPVVASLIFLAPVVGGVATFGKSALELYQKWLPKVVIEEVVKNLASEAPEMRLTAIQQLSELRSSKPAEIATAIRSLETMINRRAPKWPSAASSPGPGSDIALAIVALGGLVKISDAKGMKIQAPTIDSVRLDGLDLSGAYMRGFMLSNVSLQGAIISSVDLEMSVLRDVQMARVIAHGTKLARATLEATCLEEATLIKADFSDSKVARSDFNAANMTNAVMTGAVLYETRFRGTILSGADLSNADFGSATELTKNQWLKAGARNDNFVRPKDEFKPSNLKICG